MATANEALAPPLRQSSGHESTVSKARPRSSATVDGLPPYVPPYVPRSQSARSVRIALWWVRIRDPGRGSRPY